MEDYARLLLSRFIHPHFAAGVAEIHVVFDNPGGQSETPKELEQARRDQSLGNEVSAHNCLPFSSTRQIPNSWRDLLSCRSCKKSLTAYGHGWRHVTLHLKPYQNSSRVYYTNIGETANSTTVQDTTVIRPLLWTNANEADIRVWLHCLHSSGQRVLIFSPDTDVYHVGLTAVSQDNSCDMIVQLSKSLTEGGKFLRLNLLKEALSDLEAIPVQLRPQCLQSLYVSTGCDYF